MPVIRDAAPPTLLHPDLHKRNIFVSDDDPTIVTGLIDWQSCSVEPAFWYADEVPDLTISATPSSTNDQLEPSSERCAKAFDLCTQFLVPKISGPRLQDETLFRPFRYCYRTWRDGAVALRHELIEISHRWTELGLTGSCPFPTPNPLELAAHSKNLRMFEAAQDLRKNLSSLLNTASDGWFPPDDWEATTLTHKAIFEGMVKAVLINENAEDDEPIRDEGDLRAIWPFDLDQP